MARPEPGGALRNLRRERRDADAQIGQESLDDRDRLGPVAPGIDKDLSVRAGGEDQLLPPHVTDGRNRRGVVRVARVEERDDDAGVEDDYRHSRRSRRSVPFG